MRVYLYVILGFFLRLPKYAPIERELERKLMAQINGLESASISIDTPRWDFMCGRMKKVRVVLEGLTIGKGLRITKLVLEGEDLWVFPWLTFFLGKPRVRDAGEVYWCFSLEQGDLENFIASRGPVLRGVSVAIDPECIKLSRRSGFTAALFDIKQPLVLRGCFEVRADANIHLQLHEARALGVSAGRSILAAVHALVNPLVRAADINRMLRKVSVQVLEGFGLHSEFQEVKLFNSYADVKGRLLLFKRKVKEHEEEEEAES